MINKMFPVDIPNFYQLLMKTGLLESIHIAQQTAQQQLYDSLGSTMSYLLSIYHVRNVFIRCPYCGQDYCISDREGLMNNNFHDVYLQRGGKDCKIQCNQIYPKELIERVQKRIGHEFPTCNKVFTLHEGIVEYKAQTAVEWFSRGPYTVVEEGTTKIVVGQSVQPMLHVEFSWIDYVTLYSDKPSSNLASVHWRHFGRYFDRFEILTSAESKDDIGKPIKINWRAVGLRKLSDDEKKQLETEHWRRYLISAARKLLYEHDSITSILESYSAFELFLEKFIEDYWESPHLKENRDYLRRVSGFSSETNARILLHEALGIHFVNSEVWKDWLWAKTFRNQIAHGKPLLETKYKNQSIGKKFNDSSDIAKFCYRSVVRAIYFIRYWK